MERILGARFTMQKGEVRYKRKTARRDLVYSAHGPYFFVFANEESLFG